MRPSTQGGRARANSDRRSRAPRATPTSIPHPVDAAVHAPSLSARALMPVLERELVELPPGAADPDDGGPHEQRKAGDDRGREPDGGERREGGRRGGVDLVAHGREVGGGLGVGGGGV